MMTIALEHPHLEANLADNQWQCDNSVTDFQNFISESWRKKWNVICNRSIGKSVVPLLSVKVPDKMKKHMKNLVSFETMTAKVLIHGISQPCVVS